VGTTRDGTRIAPLFLIAGGAAGLVAGASHGDLPEGSGSAALQFVDTHPAYALVHLVSILGAVLWAVGLAGWGMDRSSPASRWLAEAAGRVALIGASVMAVQFSLDGTGLEALAALWAEPGGANGVYETTTQIGAEVMVGTALTWVVLLYGLVPLLAGSSLILTARHTLGWTGVVLGAFSLSGGTTLALRVYVLPDWLVFAGATIGVNLWILMLGVVALQAHRKSRRFG
jgi:hypothetical protein